MAERQLDVGKSVESSGKTVEEAIENALQRLKLPRERVNVTVLREASRGLLGFGAHDAIVRLTVLGEGETEVQSAPVSPRAEVASDQPFPQPPHAVASERVPEDTAAPAATEPGVVVEAGVDEPDPTVEEDDEDETEWDRPAARDTAREATEDESEIARHISAARESGARDTIREATEDEGEVARHILLDLIERMGVIADVQLMTREPEDEEDHGTLMLDIVGDDLGLLIGRRGDTLNDLQYLTRQLVANKVGHWVNLVVDVEGYKQRREDRLRQLARRMARRVVDMGRPAHMEPMNSYERRLVHLELSRMDGVETESTGEGERRKVGIFPTGWAD